MSDVHEVYSRQFHDWEQPLRGWKVWGEPVSIEPVFSPPRYHTGSIIDDGRRHTLLSSLLSKVREGLGQSTPPLTEEEQPLLTEPDRLVRERPSELLAHFAHDSHLSRDEMRQVLLGLGHSHEPFSFELFGTTSKVSLQITAQANDVRQLKNLLGSSAPTISFTDSLAGIQAAWTQGMGSEALIFEVGLLRESVLQIHLPETANPLMTMLSALSNLETGEFAALQVLFKRLSSSWTDLFKNVLTSRVGKDLFINVPELRRHALAKASKRLYAVVLRVAVKTASFSSTIDLASRIATALSGYAHPEGNEFVPLDNSEYAFSDHEEDFLQRQSHRSGMVLSEDELLSLIHLPSPASAFPKLTSTFSRTRSVTTRTSKSDDVVLGLNEHGGARTRVYLSMEERVRHTYIVGASGTGKSTLIETLARQDIEAGRGIAVIDPHGDLVDHILNAIPLQRIDDVILIDPSDPEYCVPFNVLTAFDDVERHLLASDLVSIFQRLSTSWGDQMGSVFKHAVLAFLERPDGGTLADVRRFLVEAQFRDEVLHTVRDADIVYYWKKSFPLLSGTRSVGPILTRLETFLGPKALRHMVSHRENKINFADVMNTGKILLAKLSQGLVGRENAYLLGSLLLAKFQQTAMARQAIAAPLRTPYVVYADEFHEYICPSMAEILTGARKYNLALVLAHQELRQLDRSTSVAGAVDNAYARICFRVGDADARNLASSFTHFDAGDLQKLDTGVAICRLGRTDHDFNINVERLPSPTAAAEPEAVITRSRELYGVARRTVEEQRSSDCIYADVQDQPKTEPAGTPTPTSPSAPREKSNPQAPTVAVEDGNKCPNHTPRPQVRQVEPADMGIGGNQHQILQKRIKESAERIGFAIEIEKQILGRKGSVDIFITGKGHSIACEISVTTTVDHEIGNLQKCIKAGIHRISMICPNADKLSRIKSAAEGCLPPEYRDRITYFSPDQFLDYLNSLPNLEEPPTASQLRLGKYAVQTLAATDDAAAKAKEDIAIKAVRRAMRRKRTKGPE